MSMSYDRRRALSETMRAMARENRCRACGRHAALVERRNAEGRARVFCRWVVSGRCPGDGRDLSEVLGR